MNGKKEKRRGNSKADKSHRTTTDQTKEDLEFESVLFEVAEPENFLRGTPPLLMGLP